MDMLLDNLIRLRDEFLIENPIKFVDDNPRRDTDPNVFRRSYQNFLRLVERHEFGKTSNTGENLEAMIKYELSKEEASLVYMYTAHHVPDEVNSHLRSNPKNLQPDIAEYCRLLTNVLTKLPSFNSGVVYRDISHPSCSLDDIFEQYENATDGIFCDPSFLSSHIREGRWSDERLGIQLVIHTGIKSNGKNLTELSFNSSESEVLFMRDTKFKVESIDYKSNVLELSEMTD